MILHKSTSVVVFRAAPGASREGGVVVGEGRGRIGLRGSGASLCCCKCATVHHGIKCPFPDVIPISKLKSCDSGPTRARSSFPWSALS